MNTKLFEHIIECIQAEPTQFDMYMWQIWNTKESTCGSTACIAGWAAWLTSPDSVKDLDNNVLNLGYWEISSQAIKALEITEEQAQKLFHVDNWPEKYRNEYRLLLDPQKLADCAVERIKYFMEHGE